MTLKTLNCHNTLLNHVSFCARNMHERRRASVAKCDRRSLVISMRGRLPLLLVEALVVLRHCARAHAHAGETAIVEEVLHGDLLGEIGEHCDDEIGALVGGGIAERAHAVGEVHETIETGDAGASSRGCWRLGDGVDADVLLVAIDVAEAARDALKESFGVGHVVIAVESALRGDVGESDNAAPLADGIGLVGDLEHLMERYGGDVEGLI